MDYSGSFNIDNSTFGVAGPLFSQLSSAGWLPVIDQPSTHFTIVSQSGSQLVIAYVSGTITGQSVNRATGTITINGAGLTYSQDFGGVPAEYFPGFVTGGSVNSINLSVDETHASQFFGSTSHNAAALTNLSIPSVDLLSTGLDFNSNDRLVGTFRTVDVAQIGTLTYYDQLLTGGGGNDTLSGGDGKDTLDGGAGLLDIADYQSETGTAGAYVDLANGFAQDSFGKFDTLIGIEGAWGNNQIRSGALSSVLLGDANNNFLFGANGQDYILGNGGGDYISVGGGVAGVVGNLASGGQGNDTLVGGGANDFLYGDDGSDDLAGGAGDDWLFGGSATAGAVSGVDTLKGGAGNDVLAAGDQGGSLGNAAGDAGNDTIYGAAGDDYIQGGQGSDYVYGVTGADTYRFGAGDLVSGDVDTVFTFNLGDKLSFDVTYQNHIAVVAGANAGVNGVYLADTGSTWLAWLPYQTVAGVNAEIVFV